MSDPAVREIRLSRKQLAFGVISAVSVSVVVFLLGVSVGRGVAANSNDTAIALDRSAPSDSGNAAGAQTLASASEHTASSSSAGGGVASIPMKIAEPPSPPPEMPSSRPETTSKPDVSAKSDSASKADSTIKPEAAPKPSAPKDAPVAPARPATKTDAPKSSTATAAHGDWVVQVASFTHKENADKLVTELKAAGYQAFELNPQAGGTGFYRVRVGPFTERSEADKASSHLDKKGYKSSVTR